MTVFSPFISESQTRTRRGPASSQACRTTREGAGNSTLDVRPARENRESLPFIVTSQTISALERFSAPHGTHAGRLTPIPAGTRLQVCGHGFNERTLQVRWENRQGFVFLQDLELIEFPIFSKSGKTQKHG